MSLLCFNLSTPIRIRLYSLVLSKIKVFFIECILVLYRALAGSFSLNTASAGQPWPGVHLEAVIAAATATVVLPAAPLAQQAYYCGYLQATGGRWTNIACTTHTTKLLSSKIGVPLHSIERRTPLQKPLIWSGWSIERIALCIGNSDLRRVQDSQQRLPRM